MNAIIIQLGFGPTRVDFDNPIVLAASHPEPLTGYAPNPKQDIARAKDQSTMFHRCGIRGRIERKRGLISHAHFFLVAVLTEVRDEYWVAFISIPTKQKGVVVEKTGDPEALEYKTDLPVPIPGKDPILVKNHLPQILGQEGIGTVVSLGLGQTPYNFAVGDRVIWLHRGSYCEYSAVSAEKAVKVLDGVSEEDALAVFLSGLTSLTVVKEAYPVQRGNWVLIHAAAGGAGFLMTQILKKIGAKVIGTAGGPEKVNLVKCLGADFVIDYKGEEDTWEGSLEAVKRKGTVVWFGYASGPVPPFSIQRLAEKDVKIARAQLFGYIVTREEFDYYTSEISRLLKTGQLKTKIHKTYALEDVVQVYMVGALY
ncbi:hypothetical protein N7537_010269 [Penicillium hordei]|uniref:Enoyl reductase (ER) domain-containing protein n=1 Tax=Penicillium hordei TaxID=40994 RepID=A0AAD6DV23_9EURO|nr:uncharacterized protein N7537_010269 [Penicillium hordei]KAJ5593365.1 hypothetical protein N7537_010269 [Penicillium hordei]